MPQEKIIAGVLLLLMATIAWGGNYPVAKDIFTTLDPFYMTLIRYGVSALVLLPILAITEGTNALRLDGKGRTIFYFGTLGFVGFGVIGFVGVKYSTAVHGAIIMALSPLIAAIIIWIREKTKPNNITLTCILTAFIGILLVITQGHIMTLFNSSSAFGDMLILFGTICWVLYTLGAAKIPTWSRLRYTTLTIAYSTISIAIVTIIATAIGYVHVPAIHTIWSLKWGLAFIIFPGTIIATVAWNYGIKHLGAVNGVLFVNFIPITTFIIELFAGQHFPFIEYFGATLTITALVINYFNMRRLVTQ